MASRQPMRTAVPCLLCTMTASRVKINAQSESHKPPNPIKVWWKPDIRRPLTGNHDGRWVKARFVNVVLTYGHKNTKIVTEYV